MKSKVASDLRVSEVASDLRVSERTANFNKLQPVPSGERLRAIEACAFPCVGNKRSGMFSRRGLTKLVNTNDVKSLKKPLNIGVIESRRISDVRGDWYHIIKIWDRDNTGFIYLEINISIEGEYQSIDVFDEKGKTVIFYNEMNKPLVDSILYKVLFEDEHYNFMHYYKSFVEERDKEND